MRVLKVANSIGHDHYATVSSENINRYSIKQTKNKSGESIVLFRDNSGDYCHIKGSIIDFERQYEIEFNQHLTILLRDRLKLIADDIIITSIDVHLKGRSLSIITKSGHNKFIILQKEYTRYIEEDLLALILEKF
jgi:hypothetical protein